MQIRVKCNCGEGKCPEWAIVELQGTVEAQPAVQDRLQNLQIGLLCRPSSQVSPSLSLNFDHLGKKDSNNIKF
jgi:chromosome transmission fidelity protein 8